MLVISECEWPLSDVAARLGLAWVSNSFPASSCVTGKLKARGLSYRMEKMAITGLLTPHWGICERK